ncbi:MAG: hypothetical protein A2451_11835, partial [Bdellovibrionales bacterium RIFOXYC2_FULL_39_8]
MVGIGQSDFFEMPENVRASMAWYERVDLNNWDAVNYSINKIIAIKGKIDLVESHDEHWLRLEAKINDEFHFAGINHQLIDSWKRKDEMKKLFVANDIKVAKGKTVKNFSEALAFAQEIGYPAILKPNEGVGAIGAFKIRNEEQLRSTMEQNGHYNFLMEEFITAPIVTYDGITDFSGNILFESSLKYASGVLEIVNGVDPAFYVCREISKKLSEIGKKIVQIFQLKRKFFHIELFDFDDHYAPMEINCRPPGGPIVDMMNYSCDVDLYDVYAQMMAGQKVTLSSAKDYFCGYAGRSERGFFYSLADVKKKIG